MSSILKNKRRVWIGGALKSYVGRARPRLLNFWKTVSFVRRRRTRRKTNDRTEIDAIVKIPVAICDVMEKIIEERITRKVLTVLVSERVDEKYRLGGDLNNRGQALRKD